LEKINAKKKFKIPVTYELYGYVIVEARTLKEAIKYAVDNIDDLPLPDNPEYVDGSFVVEEDFDVVKCINKKGDDKNKIIKG